jgi:hypothetical protein
MNIYYNSADIHLSDHKPILAIFEAKIKVVDQAKKSKIIQNLKQ